MMEGPRLEKDVAVRQAPDTFFIAEIDMIAARKLVVTM
jgi:hypothetical protein